MATAAIAGYLAEFYLSIDGGTNYIKLGEMKDVTLKLDAGDIDATTHDSAGWEESIIGNLKWTFSASLLFIDANTGQTNAYNALVARTLLKLRLYPKNGVGTAKYEGSGFITGWELAGPTTDAAASSIQGKGSGPLVKATQ